MANGRGAHTQAIRIRRFLSSDSTGKMLKCAKRAQQGVGAKVVHPWMILSFGIQEFREQVCLGYYFREDKRKWNK